LATNLSPLGAFRVDLDTITAELIRIIEDRRGLGLAEATSRAPKLLKEPRYRQASDPRALLADDITAAVQRLPREVARHARVLLPSDKPDDLISIREKALDVHKYSSPAKRWHRMAIFGRVANELHKVLANAQPSIRAHEVHIKIRTFTILHRFGGYVTGRRVIDFRWTVESNVTDYSQFTFFAPAHKSLRLHKWGVRPDSVACDYWARIKNPKTGAHDYVLVLKNPLPVGKPAVIHAFVELLENRKAPQMIDYIPTLNVGTLLFTVENEDAVTCTAWDIEKSQPIKEYKARVTTHKTTIPKEVEVTDIASHFRIPSPQVGRAYRVEWQ
jgi:hypothetical protein